MLEKQLYDFRCLDQILDAITYFFYRLVFLNNDPSTYLESFDLIISFFNIETFERLAETSEY